LPSGNTGWPGKLGDLAAINPWFESCGFAAAVEASTHIAPFRVQKTNFPWVLHNIDEHILGVRARIAGQSLGNTSIERGDSGCVSTQEPFGISVCSPLA
jgi:hypothetical protein